MWLLSSLALEFYVQNFSDYNAAYGAIGAVVVMLLWFYVSGFALLESLDRKHVGKLANGSPATASGTNA
jgi:hypothetical protein